MHSDYQTQVLKQLRDQQVRFAPREKKIDQVNRAERLLAELDPARTYTYEYLCFRITDYRPEVSPKEAMTGNEARHDLRLFVEDVSDSADVAADEAGEPVHTVDELSRMFNVSTKTIQRWRDQGLVSRRFLFGRRKRVGFLKSSVERFVERNRERVTESGRFSQISAADKEAIIMMARRLAATGGCPSDVARRVAERFGRSTEAVRLTLRDFNDSNPELAVFSGNSSRLASEDRERIYQLFRGGESIESLARQFNRTRTSIYRVINEMRAVRILELPLQYIPNEQFERAEKVPALDAELLGAGPEGEDESRKARPPAGLPPYLASLYDVPLLTREQEAHLFRKFNYVKFKAARLRESLIPEQARSQVMDRIEALHQQSDELRQQIVVANLRLVVSIAKKHVSPSEDFFSLVSDGNMSLLRAVEKFDFARGNKFSTYASWAIMKNFARSIPEEFRQRDRFRTCHEEAFVRAEDMRADPLLQERSQGRMEQQVSRMLSRLDDREQRIIASRFGLNTMQEPLTLKQVGAEMGVTKERVRQIEARALVKLRLAAAEDHVELPE